MVGRASGLVCYPLGVDLDEKERRPPTFFVDGMDESLRSSGLICQPLGAIFR